MTCNAGLKEGQPRDFYGSKENTSKDQGAKFSGEGGFWSVFFGGLWDVFLNVPYSFLGV